MTTATRIGDRLLLPARYALDVEVHGNPVRQFFRPETAATVEAQRFTPRGKPDGFALRDVDGNPVLLLGRKRSTGDPRQATLLTKPDVAHGRQPVTAGLPAATWAEHTDGPSDGSDAPSLSPGQVLEAWQGRFVFREERRGPDGAIIEKGLRPPQAGALFAALAHWRGAADAATIVMPTGTGKTETMLAILAHEALPLLLVVVPTNALREQIAAKFETMGLLPLLGVLPPDVAYPVVGTLRHRPEDTEQVKAVFGRCNVVVATMQVISGCSPEVQAEIVERCRYLFIDEAHHAPAPTWSAFRSLFLKADGRRVVQFTATPFRTDGRLVEGRVIFSYPLRRAQADGYFAPIRLRGVMAWDGPSADEAVARLAIEQLRADEAAGFDHVVMARTESIDRAIEVAGIYRRIAPDIETTLVHSKLGQVQRREALRRLRAREIRVVVCVDMLGEGFDFPRLKIAAIHDPHKSLAITLQFTGRFTRSDPTLGHATVVANLANPDMGERLRDLYAEDADWNALLIELSEGAVGRHASRSEFLEAFTGPPSPVALQNVFPKMSAVVYRTSCAAWQPGRAEGALRRRARLHAGPLLNVARKVLVFITQEQEPVPWGRVKEVSNTVWNLYLLHWDEERNLLFINSSDNGSLHEGLAKAVCGEEVTVIRGDKVFRCLSGISRLVLMNLGLNHTIGRAVRFSMHSGSDVGSAMTEVCVGNRIRSNLFGLGYEGGEKVTIGCSRKGRIWSYLIAYDMADWVAWCGGIGDKLLDETIAPEDVFKYAMVPTEVTERPPLVPLAVEWEEDLLRREHLVSVEIGDVSAVLIDVDLSPLDFTDTGPLGLRVTIVPEDSDARVATFEVRFGAGGARFVLTSTQTTFIRTAGRRVPLSDWFDEHPPWLHFANGAVLHGDELFTPRRLEERVAYDRARIEAWDWSGTTIRAESQGDEKRPDSIQFRVIRSLLERTGDEGFDIVFDDDEAGEAADIVAIKVLDGRVLVHLYHCKYSKADTAGSRIKDLYEVCGQAQKSVRWRTDAEALVRHMLYREGLRQRRGRPSRFEKGDPVLLRSIGQQLRGLDRDFRIFIVQPGLSREVAENEHLELLAATQEYLMETFRLPLGVIASA